MIECDVGVLFAHLGDHVFPQLESLQHIGFVHTGYAPLALTRRRKRHMGDTLDFGTAVAHGVKRFFGARKMAIGGLTPATWLTKVNITRELTNDQNIESGHQFGFKA